MGGGARRSARLPVIPACLSGKDPLTSPAMHNVSLLLGALVFLILARLFLKRLFTDVGRKALAKQAAEIHLLPTTDKAWQNLAAVEAIARPLVARGFTDVGTFVIREMPVTLRLF